MQLSSGGEGEKYPWSSKKDENKYKYVCMHRHTYKYT